MCEYVCLDQHGNAKGPSTSGQMRTMYLRGEINAELKLCELWSEGHTTIPEMCPLPIELFTQWPKETNTQREQRGQLTRHEWCKGKQN